MKSALTSSDPTVIQLDTTFGIDKAHYKLISFCYMNPATNKTEIAALTVISGETEEHFNFVLKCFREVFDKNDPIFLVDKDFTCISSLLEIFPNATILLCIFHVIKFVRTLISTALVIVDKKKVILQKFKAVLFSRDTDTFKKNNDSFTEEIMGVQVRVNEVVMKL